MTMEAALNRYGMFPVAEKLLLLTFGLNMFLVDFLEMDCLNPLRCVLLH